MKRLAYFIVLSTLGFGASLLVGCASTADSLDSPAASNPYAGGNGAFGEDPINPGEYAGDHWGAPTPSGNAR